MNKGDVRILNGAFHVYAGRVVKAVDKGGDERGKNVWLYKDIDGNGYEGTEADSFPKDHFKSYMEAGGGGLWCRVDYKHPWLAN